MPPDIYLLQIQGLSDYENCHYKATTSSSTKTTTASTTINTAVASAIGVNRRVRGRDPPDFAYFWLVGS